MKQKTVSIIIPCLNEAAFIEKVLDDIVRQDYPAKLMDTWLVDGGSTDGTVRIIQDFAKRHAGFHLLHNPARYVPQAMNQGIQASGGDLIIRMDAHASYPPDYVRQLVHWQQKTGADNVGGLWITQARSQTPKAKAIAQVLTHPLGVGNSTFRTGSKEVKEVDTVPFGCYPRAVFAQYGYYHERLQRNQDIELNKRIRRMGGKILLIPSIHCTYYARDRYRGLWKNNYQTGRWVLLASYLTRTLDALSLRHFVPLLFVGYLCGLILAGLGVLTGWLPNWVGACLAFPLVLYLLAISGASLKAAAGSSWRQAPYLFWGFLVLHIAYGLGSWHGFFEIFGTRRT